MSCNLFRKDPLVLQLKHTKEEMDAVIIKLTEHNVRISHLQMLINTMTVNYEKAHRHFEDKEKAFLNSCAQIQRYKEQFGKNFANEEFWIEIQKNESSQIASPWTNKDYDTLREELFYYGLMLHKAFILNSKSVKQNMNCLVNMWNGSFYEKDKIVGYTHLINTLFLIVPVISTTFASVSTFLKYVDKNGLGTLIIDEAGQATPYSALGALWRTCKAIVVGDPLQVEPVVTVPKELSKKFAEEFEIEASYRVEELSVQMLADSINPYGGYREYSYGKMWLGCPLVIHRRCLDPMFSISNEIAYNNRMFKKSVNPEANVLLLLNKSIWIDIKGKENGDRDHFVPAQGDKAIEMVLSAFELQNGFPNLYIISPFKTVANNIKSLLKKALNKHYPNYDQNDIGDWVDKSCGTVHTFQGKEANEVIIILGCDEKSGEGAAQWAGKKPNILNVAMTRAKYRVAVIGDSSLWKKIPNFDFAYKIMEN
ncbi:AAA domain-containing protein [Clostridium sp. WLY-B-L2]|uniref:AAA domain-containing protein n=1 Tax=Clostridium aromativorans TaxID=2836848 RepID=A0ABS8N847_9CLOT|nr:AAA domain-containing protein [Clostridium aromativorans]MCC9295969.1 AAA domain-containing protein [Clostridium aromativorans]